MCVEAEEVDMCGISECMKSSNGISVRLSFHQNFLFGKHSFLNDMAKAYKEGMVRRVPVRIRDRTMAGVPRRSSDTSKTTAQARSRIFNTYFCFFFKQICLICYV